MTVNAFPLPHTTLPFVALQSQPEQDRGVSGFTMWIVGDSSPKYVQTTPSQGFDVPQIMHIWRLQDNLVPIGIL